MLVGDIDGRPWELSSAPSAPLDRWFVRSVPPPVLRVSSWFRAAPPGRERERDTPWFYLGPVPSRWSTFAGSTHVAYLTRFAELARGGRLPEVQIGGVRERIRAAASVPRLESSFVSGDWTEWYRKTYELAHPTLLRGTVAPLVYGWNGHLSFLIGVDPRTSPAAYAEAVDSFVRRSATLEEGFEAPSLTSEPMSWNWIDLPDGFRWPTPEPMFRCPSCRGLERVADFRSRGRPWLQYLISAGCREFLYRDGPRGADPRAASIRGSS